VNPYVVVVLALAYVAGVWAVAALVALLIDRARHHA
jgi:hypothetical protein